MKIKTIDQSRNGVTVKKHVFLNKGTTVDASCQCFGSPRRVHSTTTCPLYRSAH